MIIIAELSWKAVHGLIIALLFLRFLLPRARAPSPYYSCQPINQRLQLNEGTLTLSPLPLCTVDGAALVNQPKLPHTRIYQNI